MEGIFSMKKWKSILVGLSCLSILLAAGEIPASASDEIPEQSIIYWSMWEEDEPQAEVIREAADAYQEATGISVEIQWKGREIRSLIGPALDAGEEIDLFDDDYQRMVQEHGIYLTDLKKIAASVDYEKHVMPILLEQIERWGKDKLLTMPYQPYITGVWYNKDLWEKAGLTDEDIPETWQKFLRVCRKLKISDIGASPMVCDSAYLDLLFGYQLARYVGQDQVARIIKNDTWDQVPEALQAAEDIRTLFWTGYMSEISPAEFPEGQNQIGNEEAVMFLQGSWGPNEVMENTRCDIRWGFFPWPSVNDGVDGTEGLMAGAQGFGITDRSEKKQEAFDFAYSICTGENDMKITDAVQSVPADAENAQWPEAIAEASDYLDKMKKTYMWAAGLETADYKDGLQRELVKLTKLEETPEEFIENLSNMK